MVFTSTKIVFKSLFRRCSLTQTWLQEDWWCLMPLSIIFQLYRGSHFFVVEDPEKTTFLSQVASPWSIFKTWYKKWAVKIQHCPISSKFDMWVDNDVPNWFLTLKNFYRSPFSKWLPQYHTNSTLSDFNAISYVGRLWCPELIPDIEKFLPVVIFKMATTIPHKFNIVRFQR